MNRYRLENQRDRGSSVSPSVNSCVTLGMLIILSELVFSSHSLALLKGTKEITGSPGLAPSNHQ